MQIASRVKDTTTSGGTGTITLGNSAPIGFRTFGQGFPINTSFIRYWIADQPTVVNGQTVLGPNWEEGFGTLTSANTLSRDFVLSSSNAGALVNFTLGVAKDVFCDAGSNALGRSIPFSTTIPMTGQHVIAPTNVTSALSLTFQASGAEPFAQLSGTFYSDGVSGHVPTFTNGTAHSSDAGYYNGAANIENILTAFVAQSGRFMYAWSQDAALSPVATVAPSAPTIGTATPGNTSASVAFTPSGSGGTPTSFTATATPGGATATGSSSPINVPGLTNGTGYTFTVHATNTVGNSAESAASNSVTPSAVAPTITARSVANASPTHIDLVFSAAMDQTSGSTPAAGDFAVAGGSHTPSAFAWVDSTHATITVPSYATGETTTLSYTGGTNKLKSLVGATLLANFSGATIVDNVVASTQIIREATLTTGGQAVTESGDGTAGWNYTSTGGSPTYVNTQAYVPSLSLAASADGEFRCGVGTVHTASIGPMIGMGGTSGANFGTPRPYDMDCGGASGAFRTFLGGTLRTTGVAAADNDLMKIKRAGTTVTWEKSSDGGTTWTVIDTATGQSQPQLFPIVSFNGTGAAANNLRGLGLS